MARDQIAETLFMFEECMDDNAQLSAEIDDVLAERSGSPCLEHILETRKFLADRQAFLEEMVARLLVGAPVLLRSI